MERREEDISDIQPQICPAHLTSIIVRDCCCLMSGSDCFPMYSVASSGNSMLFSLTSTSTDNNKIFIVGHSRCTIELIVVEYVDQRIIYGLYCNV